MQHKPQKTDKEVLGQTTKPKNVGGFVVTPEILNVPLSYEGTVVRCFCLGCGYSTELTNEGAQALLLLAEADIPSAWQGYYFQASHCMLCSKEYKDVSLKTVE